MRRTSENAPVLTFDGGRSGIAVVLCASRIVEKSSASVSSVTGGSAIRNPAPGWREDAIDGWSHR